MSQYNNGFKTCYNDASGWHGEQLFDKRSDNDAYASVMAMMGVTNVTKYWYSFAMKEWFRYHATKE